MRLSRRSTVSWLLSEGGSGHDTFFLPRLSQRLLTLGSMVCFPVHKGYYGKPAHHIGASDLKWLLISKLLNPQPAVPGQDALGLITIYPRPDEHFIISAAAPAAAAPSITAFLPGRTPRLQLLSRPFSVQEHLTILI